MCQVLLDPGVLLLEEERSEMKTILQDLCQMVNEIKLILAKNQM